MIQDIAPYRYHNEFALRAAQDDDIVFVFDKRSVWMDLSRDVIAYPTAKLFDSAQRARMRYLFRIDSTAFFLLIKNENDDLPEGFRFENITLLRSHGPRHLAFAGLTAQSLFEWYDTRRFCGRCGARMQHSEKERMVYCPECGSIEYPKICPAVIVGVTNGNKLLLSKYAGRTYAKYALIAGFTEIGETLEETVQREVMEEVGLRVKNIRYYKSQPWGLSNSLLAGFFCDLDGEDNIRLDETELATAEWVDRNDVPTEESDFSLTREMMLRFHEGTEPKAH